MNAKRLQGSEALEYAQEHGITHLKSRNQPGRTWRWTHIEDAQQNPADHIFLEAPAPWPSDGNEPAFGRVYQDTRGTLHLTTRRTMTTIHYDPRNEGPNALLDLLALVHQQLDGYDIFPMQKESVTGMTVVAELTQVDTPNETLSLYPQRMEPAAQKAFKLKDLFDHQR